MSLLFRLLQRFLAFLIHTSMQGEETCFGESAPFRKVNVAQIQPYVVLFTGKCCVNAAPLLSVQLELT
jgi:hypothetical protein